MQLKSLVFGFIFLTSISTPSIAKIIHVPADSSTIQGGINGAVNDDTVLVADGHYYEQINFQGKGILVTSEFMTDGDSSHIENTIIDGDSSGSVVSFFNEEDSTSIIQGFTIQNGLAIYGGGIHCDHSSPTISHCSIINNYADYGGGISSSVGCPNITKCLIAENTAFANGGGITCSDSSLMTIDQCTITRNWSSWRGSGISCFDCDYRTRITNTIVWYNRFDEIYVFSGVPPTYVTYCNIDGWWPGEGNIGCCPLFCDPDSSNYYLAENSCCVGAGEGGIDIGAFGIGCPAYYPCGDINFDCRISVSDVVYLMGYLFKFGSPPLCPPAPYLECGDTNSDGQVTVGDVVYLINYLFKGGPPPCESE